jgi:hypothetical protein
MSLILEYDFSISNGIKNIANITNPSQYDGKLYNNPKLGTSITFDKSLNQYAQIPPMTTPTNGLTFSFWFNSINDNKNARLFDFANKDAMDDILICFSDTGLTFYVQNGTTPFSNNITLSNLNNTLHYIVWTLSPNPSIWSIYIDGNLVNSFTTNVYYPNAVSRTLQYLGKSNYSNIPYFNGSISNFSIYFGNVLTQSQISTLYSKDDNKYNELYNNIYCDLKPTDNGFMKCNNCNYGVQTILSSSSQKGENDCLSKCKSTPQCTSYNYNTLNNTCTLNSSFPTHIEENVNNINSGYSLSKFGYNYSNLNNMQKSIIQKNCASQYLNNHFLLGKDIDLSPCLTIESSPNNPTNFSTDAECVYNIYTKNGLKTAPSISNNTYTDDDSLLATSDPTIDNYKSIYKKYIDAQVAVTNLNGKNYTISTPQNIEIPKIIEAFTNENDNNNKQIYLLFFFIIIILIFIYYIYNGYN